MAAENSVTVTLGYTNTEFTRKYKFGGVSASALPNVKAKILADKILKGKRDA